MPWPLFVGWFVANPLDDVQLILESNSTNLDAESLQKAAIQGMLEHVDALNGHIGSQVMTAEEKNTHQAWLMGRRSGYGLRIRIVSGRGLLIDSILSDSPAAMAGLKERDLIVAFADQPLTGLPPERVLALLEHPHQENVAVDVLRDGELRRFQLHRGHFWIQSATQNEIQIQIHFWGEGVSKALKQFLAKSDNQLILDLRDNEGGLIDEVLESIGYFTGENVAVAQRSSENTVIPLATTSSQLFTGDIVVLINKGTSGLSELFVQALREHCSVQIVGEPSAGVAAEFDFFPISDDLFLYTVSSEWRSGTGFSWKNKGIKPDVMVRTSMSNPSMGGRVLDLQLETGRRILMNPQ